LGLVNWGRSLGEGRALGSEKRIRKSVKTSSALEAEEIAG